MIISYDKKFIFFHVAKVAGTSIKSALEDWAQEPEKFKIKRPKKLLANNEPNPMYTMWEAFLWHAKAKDAQKAIPDYNDYYKFAFVRNPWDWQVSMYNFVLKRTDHAKHELVKKMQGFEEYLEWVIHAHNPYPKGGTKLQKDIISDDNDNLIVDYVGRFETLNKDFDHVCQVLGIESKLPYLNQSNHKKYTAFYNERTKKLVADHCAADIELFAYTFDGYKEKNLV